jgi:hypothetical protein
MVIKTLSYYQLLLDKIIIDVFFIYLSESDSLLIILCFSIIVFNHRKRQQITLLNSRLKCPQTLKKKNFN